MITYTTAVILPSIISVIKTWVGYLSITAATQTSYYKQLIEVIE